jgi:hypothetical protein
MLPGGAVAALFLLSLIPGWWFLRRTESSRRPRHLSSLQEVLELLGVGVLTTGLAVGAGLLISPELLLDRRFPANSGREVRLYVVLVVGVLFSALAFAELAARVVRWRNPARSAEFNIGTWWSVMRPDLVPEGCLPYVAVERSDGVTIEGVLHNYSLSPDVTHRDVALKAPVKFTTPGKSSSWGRTSPTETRAVPYTYVVIPGAEIRHIALSYPKR